MSIKLLIREGQVISIPNFQRYIQNSDFKNHFQNWIFKPLY